LTSKLAEGAVGRAIDRCKDRLNLVRGVEGSSIGIGLNLSCELRSPSILKSLDKTSGLDRRHKKFQKQKNRAGFRTHHFPDEGGWDEEQAAEYSTSPSSDERSQKL
jgi:hypothetical protein